MAEYSGSTTRVGRLPGHPAWLTLGLLLVAAALTLHRCIALLPMNLWFDALTSPDLDDLRQLVIVESVLPRVVTAGLCGALLALSGVIFQQVLRNPLAEPTTLGVSAGASLALSLASALAPGLLALGQEPVATAGAAVALLLVLALAWRQHLATVAVILAGLIVSLYSGAIGALLTLFNHDILQTVFVWGGGALNQDSWRAARILLPHLLIGALGALALVRPLTLMALGDQGARGLGIPLGGVRAVALALAVMLGAAVVSAVGVIGFVGLVAPTVVRLMGARTLTSRLVWAPLFGAALVWVTDEVLQSAGGAFARLPTGAVLALLGAPILLWLLPRLHGFPVAGRHDGQFVVAAPRRLRAAGALVAALLLGVALVLALCFVRDYAGWHWLAARDAGALLHWRAPRVAAAVCAGAMLAIAGVIVQRVTGNVMASPEVLGISSGSAFGLLLLALFVPDAGRAVQIAATSAGAFAALLWMLALGRRSGFSPTHMLLAGIALGTAFSALAAIVLASGVSQNTTLIAWMSGSTYGLGWSDVGFVAGALFVLAASLPVLCRWLDVLPLGERTALALGVDVARARLLAFLVAALLTGGATVVIGPLSFVGLIAPHVARLAGCRRARAHLLGSALLGATVMAFAEWLAQSIAFPFQIPAGLLATLVGGLYFMGLMCYRRAL